MPMPNPNMIREAENALASKGANLLTRKRFSLLGTIGAVTGLFSSLVAFGLPAAGGVSGFLAQKKPFQSVRQPLEKVKAASQLTGVAVGDFPTAVADAFGPDSRMAVAVQKASSGNIAQYAQKTLSAPLREKLSQASVERMIYSGTAIVGGAINTTLTFSQRIKTLRQMQFDMTGKMPSTWSVLMGQNLHPLVKTVRAEATGIRAGLGNLLQLGGIAGNIYMMLFSRDSGIKYMAKSAALGMGAAKAAELLTVGNTTLDSYHALTHYVARGQEAPLEVYKGLIGGLAGDMTPETVERFAEQCYTERVPPAEVVRRFEVLKQSGGEVQAAQPAAVPEVGKPITIGSKTHAPKPLGGYAAALGTQPRTGMMVGS